MSSVLYSLYPQLPIGLSTGDKLVFVGWPGFLLSSVLSYKKPTSKNSAPPNASFSLVSVTKWIVCQGESCRGFHLYSSFLLYNLSITVFEAYCYSFPSYGTKVDTVIVDPKWYDCNDFLTVHHNWLKLLIGKTSVELIQNVHNTRRLPVFWLAWWDEYD